MNANIRRCYQLLRIEEDCSDLELRRAYRRMAKILHPDKCERNAYSISKFDALNKAYLKVVSFRKKNNILSEQVPIFGHRSQSPIRMPASNSQNIFQQFEKSFQSHLQTLDNILDCLKSMKKPQDLKDSKEVIEIF